MSLPKPTHVTRSTISCGQVAGAIGTSEYYVRVLCRRYLQAAGEGDKKAADAMPCVMAGQFIRIYPSDVIEWIERTGGEVDGAPQEEIAKEEKLAAIHGFAEEIQTALDKFGKAEREADESRAQKNCTGCEDQGTDVCREAFTCPVCGIKRNACISWPGWPHNRGEVCSLCEETALGIPHKSRLGGKGVVWSSEEIDLLIELIESGKGSEEIAKEISRTQQSVEQRARRIGLKVKWAARRK